MKYTQLSKLDMTFFKGPQHSNQPNLANFFHDQPPAGWLVTPNGGKK